MTYVIDDIMLAIQLLLQVNFSELQRSEVRGSFLRSNTNYIISERI